MRATRILLALSMVLGVSAVSPAVGAQVTLPPSLRGDPRFAPPRPSAEERAALPLLQDVFLVTDPLQRLSGMNRALLAAPKPTPFRGMLRCMQVRLAVDAKQLALAAEAAAQCGALLPEHPLAMMTLATYNLGRDMQGGAGLVEGADQMTRMLVAHPDFVRDGQEGSLLFISSVHRRLSYAGETRRASALMRAFLASGIAEPTDIASDGLVMQGVYAALADRQWDEARGLLRQLKTRAAVGEILIAREAEPIWPDAARYYHGELETRRNLFDLDSWRKARGDELGLTISRASALAEHDEWGVLLRAAERLVNDQIRQYDARQDDVLAAALSALLRAPDAAPGLALGQRYFAAMADKAKPLLNIRLSLGVRLLAEGQREAGLALIAAGYREWQADPSLTEGDGGRAYMASVRSCATGTPDGEAARAEVERARAIAPGAYLSALQCRGETAAYAAAVTDQITSGRAADRMGAIVRLRRIEAGLPTLSSPVAKAALSDPALRAALDAGSRTWAEGIAIPADSIASATP